MGGLALRSNSSEGRAKTAIAETVWSDQITFQPTSYSEIWRGINSFYSRFSCWQVCTLVLTILFGLLKPSSYYFLTYVTYITYYLYLISYILHIILALYFGSANCDCDSTADCPAYHICVMSGKLLADDKCIHMYSTEGFIYLRKIGKRRKRSADERPTEKRSLLLKKILQLNRSPM